jgi:hypothetical protein
MKRLPAPLLVLITILLAVGRPAGSALAQDLGGSVLRDYPVALTIPRGRLEISLDYLLANPTTDAVGLPNNGEKGAGDLRGLQLFANYGIQRRTTVMSAFAYRDLEFGLDSMPIISADLALKRNLILRGHGWVPILALDGGVRFDATTGGDEMLLDAKLDNGRSARLAIGDQQDVTPYARLTAGQIWGHFFPNLFLEYGHSVIDAKAKLSGQDSGTDFTNDLSRNEDYLKSGLSLLVKFPYVALLHLEYDYIRLFRDHDLDLVDDNQFVKADLNFYMTPSVVFNIGAGWSQHQFNGQIPFLYNAYSQNRFDQSYGFVQVGFSVLFGH